MRPTFEYLPARDGLALLSGGPTQAGYADDARRHPAQIWQPRFSTETDLKGHSNIWNGEYQFYADPEYTWSNRYSPFKIEQQSLLIRAERAAPLGFRPGELPDNPLTHQPYAWVSGVLTSKHRFSQQGGYFEIDAKMPQGSATWPAFWLLPVDEQHPPEIDIIEYLGHEPDRYRATLISIGPVAHEATVRSDVDLSRAYHRYAIDWSDTALSFYLDDVLVSSTSISGQIEFWQPFYILVNVAIGSNKAQWVPAPDNRTPSPADMLVRSVRVWQRIGPLAVKLSSYCIWEGAPSGSRAAILTCDHSDGPTPVTFKLLQDADFAIEGEELRTTRPFSFITQRSLFLIIQAADTAGRTWQQPVSVAVLDEGRAPNLLAFGSQDRLRHPSWLKFGVTIRATSSSAELLLATNVSDTCAVEQLVKKPPRAERYVFSADLKPHGSNSVKLEISRDYGKNVQAMFDLTRAATLDRFASPDPKPFLIHDCRCIALADGYSRCLIEFTTDDAPTLRVSVKLERAAKAAKYSEVLQSVESRSLVRLVKVDAPATPTR